MGQVRVAGWGCTSFIRAGCRRNAAGVVCMVQGGATFAAAAIRSKGVQIIGTVPNAVVHPWYGS